MKVRFEISNFEKGYRKFFKIRKLIPFGQEWQNLGIWAQNFQQPISNFKSAPPE